MKCEHIVPHIVPGQPTKAGPCNQPALMKVNRVWLCGRHLHATLDPRETVHCNSCGADSHAAPHWDVCPVCFQPRLKGVNQ